MLKQGRKWCENVVENQKCCQMDAKWPKKASKKVQNDKNTFKNNLDVDKITWKRTCSTYDTSRNTLKRSGRCPSPALLAFWVTELRGAGAPLSNKCWRSWNGEMWLGPAGQRPKAGFFSCFFVVAKIHPLSSGEITVVGRRHRKKRVPSMSQTSHFECR